MVKSAKRAAILIAAMVIASGCAPVMFGAATAVVVDERMERDNGDDGLF